MDGMRQTKLQKHLMGWDRPPLATAVDFLFDRYTADDVADLDRVVLVVPGARAGRRLLEMLTLGASSRRIRFRPPRITTVGNLPELLYQPQKPFANEITQRLAWVDALWSLDVDSLRPIIPHPPGQDEVWSWMELGQLLQQLHRELASDVLTFDDVLNAGRKIEKFPELDRWKALSRVQRAYHDRLDELELWDRQTARTIAIEKEECVAESDIVMLGTVDLNTSLKRMLDQVSDQVTVLVFANESNQSRFDRYGCLVPDAWKKARIDLSENQVHVVESNSDQAEATARIIASLDGRYASDEITIAVPDDHVISHLERRLGKEGIATSYAAGRTVAQSLPLKLLVAVSKFVEGRRFSHFASLVRHPDVCRVISSELENDLWLNRLDDYQVTCLPTHVDSIRLKQRHKFSDLQRAIDVGNKLVLPVDVPARPLSEWPALWKQVLQEFYGGRLYDREIDHENAALHAVREIVAGLDELAEMSGVLDKRVTAADALSLAVSLSAQQTLPPKMTDDTIELLGWLDLALDDAPVSIVTSFNEGIVPSSERNDLFLPDRLRRELGIVDQSRRYARDAYALTLLRHSKERLELVVGRRNAEGDPLIPSRLLFTGEPMQIAGRASTLFGSAITFGVDGGRSGQESPSNLAQELSVPLPDLTNVKIDELSATGFASYLRCPYRFYLGHILRLGSADDMAEELDGGAFGSLAHRVVESVFNDSKVAASSDVEKIQKSLEATLNRLVENEFPKRRMPAVDIQIEQLHMRLRALARAQAQRVEAGWQIRAIEDDKRAVEIDVDGEPFRITGRIDRVDFHPETRELVVLDYKTSEAGSSPEKTHQSKDGWIDLQLPLYRLMVLDYAQQNHFNFSSVKCGYVLLPRDSNSVEFVVASWSDEDYQSAEAVASDVIRNIRRGQFWPPTDPPPAFSEPFAMICQDDVFDRRMPVGTSEVKS